jgi:nucleoside-diphosphate-sugar epimerase
VANVLVTGANGFIGSHLVEALLQKQYAVRALVRKRADLKWIKNLPIEIHFGEISNYDSLLGALNNIDYLMHVAGTTKGRTYADYERINIFGTENLVRICLDNIVKLKKFIFFSSLAATGGTHNNNFIHENIQCTPVSFYGKSKQQAESLLLRFKEKIPLVILRLSAIYGPRDTETLAYFKFLKKGIRPVWPGTVSSCHVRDAVHAAILCLNKNIESGNIYNVSDGMCYTIDDIAKVAEQIMGKKAIRIKCSIPILSIFAKFNYILSAGNTVFGPDKIKELTKSCWVCDINKTQQDLGYIPEYTIERGIQETIIWYQEQKWL